MVENERELQEYKNNIVEILARVLLGQIKREGLDENNQAVLGYYLGLMDDDPKFRKQIDARKNELTLIAKNGRKISLFTSEELAKAKRHRKHQKGESQIVFQSELWLDHSSKKKSTMNPGTVLDPERKLVRIHGEMQNRFSWDTNSLIKKEVQQKKLELRDLIGLPVQRGKDPHVNDDYYKFLVRKIVTFDAFGILNEFDRVLTAIPPELDTKINQVKELVDELLNNGLNLRQRHERLNEFIIEYGDKWGG